MIIYSKHLQTAKPDLLLIQPSILQLLDELRMILLKSLQHTDRRAIVETIIDGIERCVLTSISSPQALPSSKT